MRADIGFTVHKWTDDEITRASTMWLEGMSATQIAFRLDIGVSRNAVIGMAHRRNWPRHGHVQDGKRNGQSNSAKRERKPRVARKPGANRNWFGGPPEPRKPSPAVEHAQPPDCQPVTLMERTAHQCGWILGATNGPDTLMCGAPKDFEPPYCGYHAAAARGVGGWERPDTSRRLRGISRPDVSVLASLGDNEAPA